MTRALVALADGDRRAFDTVYEAAWPRVHALASRLLRDNPAADDVAQDALVAVFDRACDFDASLGPAMPWILGIAAWRVRTHRRRVQRRREDPWGPAADAAGDDPEAAAQRRELVRAVEAVLGELDERDRQALLATLGDRPATATFRKRLERARRRLIASLGRSYG